MSYLQNLFRAEVQKILGGKQGTRDFQVIKVLTCLNLAAVLYEFKDVK